MRNKNTKKTKKRQATLYMKLSLSEEMEVLNSILMSRKATARTLTIFFFFFKSIYSKQEAKYYHYDARGLLEVKKNENTLEI